MSVPGAHDTEDEIVPEEPGEVVCPACGRIVPVPEEWRMVECPRCHAVITRMDDDARYD